MILKPYSELKVTYLITKRGRLLEKEYKSVETQYWD